MQPVASRRLGITAIEVTVVCVVVLVLAAVLLPMLAVQRGSRHGGSRMTQNSMQLRGIHQGMFTYAQSNKTGGRDGWYPGLDAQGQTIEVAEALPAAMLAALDDVPGYAAAKLDHVEAGEINTTDRQGLITRAYAELASGDFIPAGSAGYFLNPADTVKTEYIAGGGMPFTAANISYTMLDLARHDGGVYPLTDEWKETINTQAILLGDRAVGDGNDPATRSSVWTDPGSGDWRGSLVRNDGSTSFESTPGPSAMDLRYGKRVYEAGATDNLFSNTFGLNAADEITSTSAVLYDEADPGTDPAAF